ncbi:hypothetical protein [Vibrio sonorensis]|uniref:hypothetical protein n=1 Tax=Vibrio sonorensis TaxID=1004316 RepID=UPI0008D98558|nr:hypothetical protein [Vibrio sonorensis]
MFRLLIYLALMGLPITTLAHPFHIITLNEDFATLRDNQAKMLFRGRLAHIDGLPTLLLDLPQSSKYREDFYRSLLKKSPSQMNAIWARQSFSGKASAPDELLKEDAQLIKTWLKQHPNGIAYVPDSLLPQGVRVLYTLNSSGSL